VEDAVGLLTAECDVVATGIQHGVLVDHEGLRQENRAVTGQLDGAARLEGGQQTGLVTGGDELVRAASERGQEEKGSWQHDPARHGSWQGCLKWWGLWVHGAVRD
jgi:hypothetical protein